MRVLDELVRAGRLRGDVLTSYDSLAPAYDPQLERARPQERPPEIVGIERARGSPRWEEWRQSLQEKDLLRLPWQVQGRVLLAEHTCFRRPDADWPEEERVSGPVPAEQPRWSIRSIDDVIPTGRSRTRKEYEQRRDDIERALVLRNRSDEISTPAGRWLALNPAVGERLGWSLSAQGLFKWVDRNGETMVESLWWRDGWVELKPPLTFATLGEGWLVLCSPEGYSALLGLMGSCSVVIGTRRGCRSKDDQGRYEQSRKVVFAERPP